MPSDVLMNRHMAKLGMAPQLVSWSDGSLTIHEVSKFFSVPIAEAAAKLSVCGSVLQRICKENGIARWPYRKITAGKSVEEIIEEGLKELATNPSAYRIAEKQPPPTPENTSGSPTTVQTSDTPAEPDASMNVGHRSPKRLARHPPEAATAPAAQLQKSSQRTVSLSAQTRSPAPGNTTSPLRNHQQSNNPATTAPAAPKPKSRPSASSAVDDFKTGFPSKGLRRHSTRWWGAPSEQELAATASAAEEEEETDVEVESDGGYPTATSLLVKTKRKASQRGRGAIAHAVTRGYGLHRLGAKDAATLRFVFGDYLPEHWTDAFPAADSGP